MGAVVRAVCGASFALVLLWPHRADAIPDFFNTLPNSAKVSELSGDDCLVCHQSAAMPGFRNLNLFGMSFEDQNNPSGADFGKPFDQRTDQGAPSTWHWSPAVASDDADGDEFTNGQELQDDNGDFDSANPSVHPAGSALLVSRPAEFSSKPPVINASFPAGVADPNDPNRVSTSVEEKSSAELAFAIIPTNSTDPVRITASVPWLTLKPGTATTSGATLVVDASMLDPNSYEGTVSVAQIDVYRTDTLYVHLQVTPQCGNHKSDAGELCDPSVPNNECCSSDCKSYTPQNTECRASVDAQCDPHEVCTGTAASCPAQSYTAEGTGCTIAGCVAAEQGQCSQGVCKEITASCGDGHQQCGEACDPLVKNANDCCNDDDPATRTCQFYTAGDHKLCRAVSGDCDAPDFCAGGTTDCSTDAVLASTSVCRPANAGGCDVPENCTGLTKVCPDDRFRPVGDICHDVDASGCDTPERCDGTGRACPANAFLPEGTYCSETEICSIDGKCDHPIKAQQSKEQVSCLHKWNAAAAKAGAALSKQAGACFAKSLSGKLSGDLDACVDSPSQKSNSLISKADHAARASCAKVEEPGFGTSDTEDLSGLASDAVADAYHDVFGPDLDAAVPADAKDEAVCQSAIAKNFSKCIGGRFASFATCVKRGLKSKKPQITDFIGVQNCLGFESNSAHVVCSVLDAKNKTRKALDKKCSIDPHALGEAFPGCQVDETDGVLDRTDLYGCIDQVSKCRTCKALKAWGNLATDCDRFDGPPEDSCD